VSGMNGNVTHTVEIHSVEIHSKHAWISPVSLHSPSAGFPEKVLGEVDEALLEFITLNSIKVRVSSEQEFRPTNVDLPTISYPKTCRT
jgi:hypothetical protein